MMEQRESEYGKAVKLRRHQRNAFGKSELSTRE